jgi:hypothetical protein
VGAEVDAEQTNYIEVGHNYYNHARTQIGIGYYYGTVRAQT